ncbi:hypothetical protein B6N60_03241 [Richelia sinica FACHB-800]|uniref:HPr kinase n=1 Tax=Richelia sinica FACHB-800 TaxID=1357546 RepID=A0A975TAU0_9NOST|nr:hypothetical protein [Richelia sinica]MBD2663363.1 hypothetical protein [Richelia sinica FACHB-800]QXE24536.1 hypothetical protein B6N60_03241 [Richelia sinica FACHB-800]
MLVLPRLQSINEYNQDLFTANHSSWQAGICLISYGVRIGIRVNVPKILERLIEYLPPGWESSPSSEVDKLYSLIVYQETNNSDSLLYYKLYFDQEELINTTDIEDVFETLDSELRLQVGIAVKDWLFVHAGVVGWRGKAIVIPGRSFSGKTTLVAALVKAGASYYSDEYAVLDANGLVHPYPRRLSIRQGEGERVKRCSVEELKGTAGTEPLPVGLIVHVQYQSGVQWCPKPMSSGHGVLALLDNTIVASLRPDFALPILASAVSGALCLEGTRGEAEDVAMALLQQLED